MADHLVKLIHARDLAGWERLPAYEKYSGKTLAQYRAEVKARNDFEGTNWRVIEAKRLVDGKDDPKVYRSETVDTPWPMTFPGRRSVRLDSPDQPGTTFETAIGRVKRDRLKLPLFIKHRKVDVRYLAADQVAAPDKIAKATALLAGCSKSELDALQAYFTSPGSDPLLFVSHRWESLILPDPDGRQLRKLKALKDCYLIYDYTSFPQDMTTAEARNDLTQVLAAMNSFIDNLLVLSDQDYMNRGWCLYEYLTGSLTHRIVCDEINSPALVRLRNLVATQPNPPGIGSTYREAVNAKNQFILETVNAILPLFDRAGFTVPADREIVQRLLIDLLQKSLPRKQEYMPYVGEWKTMEWTGQELAASFKSKLTWEALQYDQTIPIFEPVVPDNLPAAVAVNYKIQKQPKGFGSAKYNWDFSGLTTLARVFKVLAGILIVIILWALYRLALWIFMR